MGDGRAAELDVISKEVEATAETGIIMQPVEASARLQRAKQINHIRNVIA